MAYQLTQRTKDALSRENIEPNLVLCIKGMDTKYAVRINKKLLRYDIPNLNYDDPNLFYDGLIDDDESSDLISLSGTTTSIAQQLDPDKGAASSTQTLTLRMIDRNEEITKLVSPGIVLEDVMYTDAKLYFGLYDTAFPEDYLEIFNGKIMGVNPAAGTIDLVLTHPEDLKRSSIFEKAETELTQVMNFDSAQIQDLFIQKRSDVVGAVTIEYTSAILGDNAVVSVVGNAITVQVDTTLTKAKTVKKKIENSEDANQLVTVKITGNPNTIQAVQPLTTLSSSTEAFVNSVNGFLLPYSPLLKTYIRIGDEIMEYTGIDTVLNKFTGITRQSVTSFGATHAVGDQVSSFYKLGDATLENGNAIDLALYLLLSKGEEIYTTQEVDNVVNVPGVGSVANSVFVPGKNLVRDENVTVGDLATLTGSGAGNNFTDKVVFSATETDAGTYLVIDGVSLNTELGATCELTLKSQYNVLPDGAGLLPNQVDIAQFKRIQTLHSTAIAQYELYLKDTVNSKDFINTKIFLPSALYSVPRKGRVSVGVNAPALYDENSKNLKLNVVKDPKDLKLQRSVNKNFYNAVVYQYNPDSVEDRFLNKNINVSADSSNRIGAPSRVFKIEAEGLRPSIETTDLIQRNSTRFLERYKYGAESIKLEVLFKTGFGVEVGDAILFGDSQFYIADTKKGSKDFSPRVMEVMNKEWNWKTGNISLTLLDTSYSANFRYGVFSPSSLVGTGSTVSEIIITKSFGTPTLSKEKDKWSNYIGREILVHSEDWTVSGTTYITGFDPANDNKMLVAPPLSFSPSADYIVDIVAYADVDPLESFYKNVHCFFTPQVSVVAGVSGTQFTVAPGDVGKFFIGSYIRVHNYDYTTDSEVDSIKVVDIIGNDIYCDDLSFTPNNTMYVDLIGFASDEGAPYVWL